MDRDVGRHIGDRRSRFRQASRCMGLDRPRGCATRMASKYGNWSRPSVKINRHAPAMNALTSPRPQQFGDPKAACGVNERTSHNVSRGKKYRIVIYVATQPTRSVAVPISIHATIYRIRKRASDKGNLGLGREFCKLRFRNFWCHRRKYLEMVAKPLPAPRRQVDRCASRTARTITSQKRKQASANSHAPIRSRGSQSFLDVQPIAIGSGPPFLCSAGGK
jgi:hypothetical protein